MLIENVYVRFRIVPLSEESKNANFRKNAQALTGLRWKSALIAMPAVFIVSKPPINKTGGRDTFRGRHSPDKCRLGK